MDIRAGLMTLIPIIAGVLIIIEWKKGEMAKVGTTFIIGGLVWALVSGVDVLSLAWKVISGIFKLFGLS